MLGKQGCHMVRWLMWVLLVKAQLFVPYDLTLFSYDILGCLEMMSSWSVDDSPCLERIDTGGT